MAYAANGVATVLAEPCALYDSTSAQHWLSGPFSNELRTFTATGMVYGNQGVAVGECIPVEATSVIVTISAIDPQGSGNLRLSPAGISPNGGVVNYANNPLNNANTVIVPVGPAGQLDVYANGPSTNVRVVALGYISDPSDPASAGLRYNALTPCAVADSRSNQNPSGSFVGPFYGNTVYPDIDVVGSFPAAQGGKNTDCGVPVGADAVVLNLVAVGATGGSGYLSAATGGLNPSEAVTPFADIGMNNATTVVVDLDGGETVAIDIDRTVGLPTAHIRAVVMGYFDDTGDSFTPVTGCAAFDSRPGFGASGTFLGKRASGTATTYQIAGTVPAAQGGNGGDCGIPTGANSVLINLVAVQADEGGNFRAYATGSTPTGGVLNFASLTPPLNNSNAIVVPLSSTGQIDLYTNTWANNGSPTTHARGVILGYYN